MVFSPLETTCAVTSAVKRGNPRAEPRRTKTADSVFVQITQLGRHLTIVIHLNNYICKTGQVPVKQRAGWAQEDGAWPPHSTEEQAGGHRAELPPHRHRDTSELRLSC